MTKGLEETGRLFRYHELKKIAKRNQSIILTGHHTKDYAESLFLHLTRGGGRRAFFTLPPFDGNRFLPLVFFEDIEIEKLYEFIQNHFPIFEDESNSDLNYKRNRLRHSLIPILKSENWNFHKTYWNFHENENWDELFSNHNPKKNFITNKMFRIPHDTWKALKSSAKKELIDFHLKQLGLYPLYKSGFENFNTQSEGERAYLENKNFVLYKSKFGDLFIIDKKSPVFKKPNAYSEGETLCIEWNLNKFKIQNPEKKYNLGSPKPGEKIEIRSGKKEISECMRERDIPFFLRGFLPILYYENRPIQILFSLFAKDEKNYPKRIFIE
ncbi:tRNA lysidine(34) synthetase TilS [Leptospira sp. 96542]|nr:tRNA lysidine(34) synthetase TilS [Leptospira sp. 96542]